MLLLDGDGREVTHIDSEAGALRISTIERIVRDEVHGREDDADGGSYARRPHAGTCG